MANPMIGILVRMGGLLWPYFKRLPAETQRTLKEAIAFPTGFDLSPWL
jgi:hypothetical protein